MARSVLLLLLLILNFGDASAAPWQPKPIPSKAELKKKLTPEQYKVTQEDGTERPFQNEYWNTKKDGIYVDIVSGEPLFSSIDKYDSGTGWPSFTRPLVKENLVEKEDRSLFAVRTEIRSKHGNSHLGHVFNDGPKPTGLRYCMNSAALRFVPKDKLAQEGYGQFLPLFTKREPNAEYKRVIFAAGCFWCIQPPFDKLKSQGVISAIVGYAGGKTENPTYKQVSQGDTGHIEVIEITYDPAQITFEKLLQVFWRNIDPYDAAGQFCDKGPQYISAVFYATEEEKKAFEKSKSELIKSGQLKDKVATRLIPAARFWPAEDYHQSYYQKNPLRYKLYRSNCGRDRRLKEVWG